MRKGGQRLRRGGTSPPTLQTDPFVALSSTLIIFYAVRGVGLA